MLRSCSRRYRDQPKTGSWSAGGHALIEFWSRIFALIGAGLLAVLAAGHALLYKRDPRAAWGWIAVCLMFPVAGPLLYFLFGINRTRTRARQLRKQAPSWFRISYERAEDHGEAITLSSFDLPAEYTEQARISQAVTGWPLVAGNCTEIFHNGEAAYPAMLEAIRSARHAVFLETYIFETNRTGHEFIEALAEATARGVDVRVLLDGFGEWYSWPHAGRLLRARGVRTERFLPLRPFPPTPLVNLRTHRKVLVVDDRVAFTGGMNIGDRHLANDERRAKRVIDAHFRLQGPIIAQVKKVFLEDWGFVTGNHETPDPVPPSEAGNAACRTIVNGPNEDLDKLPLVMVGAVAAARRRVAIMTPYFLPPRELVAALQAAALRGLDVSIILPAKNNLPFVHWASRNMLWELLQRGVNIYYRPPPFAHTKLFLIDDYYCHIGTANLDPRSLRLNFEVTVEVFDRGFAQVIAAHIESVRAHSRSVTLQEMDERPLPERMRDAFFWLFSPYL